MGVPAVGVSVFVVAALVSLSASWVLVSRIERLGTHFGISEALLGVIAALAADSPEITSAITAFGNRQGAVGAGVVLGSNVFNLAALLGLSALVAGRIHLHRRVVLLSGAVAVWVAGMSALIAFGSLSSTAGLVLVGAVLVSYVTILGLNRARLRRLPMPRSWTDWLAAAVADEEGELSEGETHRAFRQRDLSVAGFSLLVVVGASVTMERAVSALGHHFAISDLVIGALVLAGVTSLPNAVAASYLALRGRGAAVLSTALNSNALNVAVGWLLPAALTGLALRSGGAPLVALFYLGLTVGSLAIAYYCRGLDRRAAFLIIGTYFAFVGSVLAAVGVSRLWLGVGLGSAMSTLVMYGLVQYGLRTVVQRQRGDTVATGMIVSHDGHNGGPTLLPGWSEARITELGFGLAAAVAAVDSALGSRVLLLGLVSVAPCCVLLTGRWRPTALAGLWAISLAVVLGLPDGIWATYVQFVFLALVCVVSLVAAAAGWMIQRRIGVPA